MSDSSGSFAWKLFPGARKQCRQCLKEPLRVQDVGEHRRLWPGTKTDFLCKSCQSQNIQERIRERMQR